MTLTLAIPVRNDPAGLRRLVRRVAALGCVERIAILDDGSDTPVTAGALLPDPPARAPDLTIRRHDISGGPGRARNTLIGMIETEHMLFFDSDDLPTPELAHLYDRLKGRRFDFCLFQHADSRMARWGGWGPMPLDAYQWHLAGLDRADLDRATAPQLARLAQTANYPWNKIYRTGFLRAHGLGCSEILVHEDIELHWMSLLHASDVLVSARVAACHFVHPGGNRLTNFAGRERLDVFAVLQRISGLLPPLYQAPFARFASGLFDWIRHNIQPAFHAELDRHVEALLRNWLTPGRIEAFIGQDPLLARRLILQMRKGAA